MTSIVLFQPEIAGNVGTIIRSCACFNMPLQIIEPCGFPFDMQRIKKSALDYIDHVKIIRHKSFEEFFNNEILEKKSRLVLATTKGSIDCHNFIFQENDAIIFGRESSGVPEIVSTKAHAKIFIPMKNNMRSLNLAVSCGIISAFATK